MTRREKMLFASAVYWAYQWKDDHPDIGANFMPWASARSLVLHHVGPDLGEISDKDWQEVVSIAESWLED